MSQSVKEHRQASPPSLNLAILTVSDTRTIETDSSGALIIQLCEAAGHRITEREIVLDDPAQIRPFVLDCSAREEIHALLITGGTGISVRDQTYETIHASLTKLLPGYGELFRMLSYAQIGPACILSRAIGGLVGQLVVLTMPGSRAAVDLAMKQVILPELPHLVREARKK